MTTHHDQHDHYCLEAVGRLTTEFQDVLPEDVVSTTVVEARQDLDGQVNREALAEMLHRLALYRLDQLCQSP